MHNEQNLSANINEAVSIASKCTKQINSYLLDPLSVIIKLAILSKKTIGSKINIGANVVYIQEAGIWQGIVRFVYKVKKDEIQYLYNPIQIASAKYLSDQMIKQYPRLRNLFTNAINGLKNLTETYKQDILFTHVLFMYESLINNYLEAINTNDTSNTSNTSNTTKFNPYLFKPDPITQEYDSLTTNFNDVWTDQRINIVLNMVEFIDKDSGYDKSIRCLEDLMNIIDQEIQLKVNDIVIEPIKDKVMEPISESIVEPVKDQVIETVEQEVNETNTNTNQSTETKIVKNDKNDKNDWRLCLAYYGGSSVAAAILGRRLGAGAVAGAGLVAAARGQQGLL